MARLNVKAALGDIDSHMDAVAQNNSTGSDLNQVAYAIHNLVAVVRQISDDLDALTAAAGRR